MQTVNLLLLILFHKTKSQHYSFTHMKWFSVSQPAPTPPPKRIEKKKTYYCAWGTYLSVNPTPTLHRK